MQISTREILNYPVHPVGSPQQQTLQELIATRTDAGCSHIHLFPIEDDLETWEALVRMLPRCTAVEYVIDSFHDAGTVLRDNGMRYVDHTGRRMIVCSKRPSNVSTITDDEEMALVMKGLGAVRPALRCYAGVVTLRFKFGEDFFIDATRFLDSEEKDWHLLLRIRLPVEESSSESSRFLFTSILAVCGDYPTFEQVEHGRKLALQESNMTIVESNSEHRHLLKSLPPSLVRLFAVYEELLKAENSRPNTVLPEEEKQRVEAEFEAAFDEAEQGIDELKRTHPGEWLVRVRGASDPDENRDLFFATRKEAVAEARRIQDQGSDRKRISFQHLVEQRPDEEILALDCSILADNHLHTGMSVSLNGGTVESTTIVDTDSATDIAMGLDDGRELGKSEAA